MERTLDFNQKRGFICDMDGVIYHGNRILPGVPEFIQWLHDENKEFLFLTNNSGYTPRELQQKCSATRFLRNSDRIIEKKQRHSKKHFRARSNASTAPEKAGSRPCKGAGFFGARRSGFAAPPAPSKPKG